MQKILFGLALLLLSSPSHAKWYEAQSDNFVIYADDSEKDVRRFAEMLEQYHASMEYVTGRDVEKPSPSNRVTIFAVGSQRDIRNLAGSKSRSIAGFYIPRASGSKAFVQDIRLTNGYPDFSTVILLHEYAHHFFISGSRYAMPRWITEGQAEFFAAAAFNNDGSVQVGRPAQHRARELAFAEEVTVQELLDQDLYRENKGSKYDAFYGRSWLLYHFLTFNEPRRGQLRTYQLKVANGAQSIDAAREAFGDLDELEDQLDKYLKQRRMLNFKLRADLLEYGAVTVRQLSPGESKMMPVRMRSQRGVNAEQAAELLEEARDIAKKYQKDAPVLAALAEAEFDAGNNEEAIAAADAALAIDPKQVNAYVQKGYALFRIAEDADDPDAAYKAAMAPFSALNKIENDHPLPLIHFYRSFAERGQEPTEQAKFALERAAELAPFDKSLWFNVAMMQANDGRIGSARRSLAPLAADPHGGSRAKGAKSLIALMENAEEGTPFNPRGALTALLNRADEEDEAEDDSGDGSPEGSTDSE